MNQNNRVKDPSSLSGQNLFVLVASASALAIGAIVWGSITISHSIAGTAESLPADPFERIFAVFGGRVAWLPLSTWILVGLVAAVAVLAFLMFGGRWSSRKKRTRVDSSARYMGIGMDIEALNEKSARATAERLGVTGSVGVPIGKHLYSGNSLFGSWEDMHIDIWGPRTGKTTSRAVPAILDAPGGCLVTSNKRDVVDASRGPRAARGPVWVFDPQGIALEPPSWYWNPLSYVTDEVKAAKLAEHFASGSREPGAKTDAYFDPAGQDLLSGFLLAAALDKRPITDVYRWLTRPQGTEAVKILERHGFDLTADQVAGVVNAPDKQRGGIFGTAQQMAACLTNRAIVQWVTRMDENDDRPTFDADEFVRAGGTLYSLSKEGKGTAGPLVTGLTVAVVEAAEELASKSPGGRLTVPLLGVLDEAANVCRWRALPDLYSHYGSRGIVLMTILQSWSQGTEVWGEAGMKKLWSAANVKCYGGGVSETNFLEDVSKLIGEHDRLRTSVSMGDSHRSVSQQVQRERTMDVAALGAMPKGRAVVIASGSRPTLISTQPWMRGPHAEAVRASIRANDPGAEMNLKAAEEELLANEAQLERMETP